MRESKPGESESGDELAAVEIARLRARVQQLEAEISHKPPRNREREVREEPESPNIRDLPERAIDEGSKLLRGLVLAAVEPLRIAGDLASQFGDEVRARNRPDRVRGRSERRSEETSPRGLVSSLPGDISAGVSKILDESLNIPGKVVDRFYEAYKETESLQRTRAQRELSRAEESLARAERLAKSRREEKSGRKTVPETEPTPSSS
jgi:hypothetical protein